MTRSGHDGGGRTDRFDVLSAELRAVLDLDGVLRQVTATWHRMLGWTPDQLTGSNVLDLVHHDDRTTLQQQLDHLGQGVEAAEVELRLRSAGDGLHWVRCALGLEPDAAQALLVAVDITDQQHDRAARALVEAQSGIGTWETEVDSGRTIWSQITHRLHGTDPSTGGATVELSLSRYPPASRAVISRAFERLRTTGEPYDLDLAFLAPDGSERTVRTAGRAVQRDGVVLRVFGTFEDITEQLAHQRGREELERTQLLLEESQRLARIGHWQADLATGRLTWSKMIYELFGLDPTSYVLTRSGIRTLLHPDDVPLVDALEEQTLRTGEHEVDYRVVRPDGRQLDIHQRGRLEVDPQTGERRVLGTLQDVTTLRRTEQALRHNEELLRRVLAATNDGWWDLDLITGDHYYSDRWWELFGCRPDELPNDPEPWRTLVADEDLAPFEAALNAVVEERAPSFVLPLTGLHRDGHRVPMVVRGLVDYDADDRVIRISGATSDVTEAREAERAKEAFISTISHELRTPLTSIGGALEVLAAGVVGELSPPMGELVDVALRNTTRLRALIDDLLDLERLTTDQQGLRRATQPLHGLLAETIEEHQPLADVHGVRFALTPPAAEVLVSVDRTRVQQVVANYLSNAAKFAPAGSTVEVVVPAPAPDQDHVRVEVVDRGPGVPEAAQARIFERFVQADPTDPRSRGGTGLGLAISREIIEGHGGAVGVSSTPGHTRFWFELPLTDGTSSSRTVAGDAPD